MREIPNRQNLLRPKEQYATVELGAYAREILTRDCEDTVYSKKLRVSWDTEDSLVYLMCEDLEKEFPTYQMNISSKSSVQHNEVIYMFDEQYTQVRLYQVDPRSNKSSQVDHPNPHELTVIVMQYLRERPSHQSREPQNSRKTEGQFRSIMANLAIDVSVEGELVDLGQFVDAVDHTPAHQAAIDVVLSRGITVDDKLYPYTRSIQFANIAMGQRVIQASQRQILPKDPTHE